MLTFPIFSKWQQIVDWDVLRSSANSQVLLYGLHFTNSIKVSWLRSTECPGLDSFMSQWCITRTKPWKPVLDLTVSNNALAMQHTRHFLSCFCSIFIILKLMQHYMLNIHFVFLLLNYIISGCVENIGEACSYNMLWKKRKLFITQPNRLPVIPNLIKKFYSHLLFVFLSILQVQLLLVI